MPKWPQACPNDRNHAPEPGPAIGEASRCFRGILRILKMEPIVASRKLMELLSTRPRAPAAPDDKPKFKMLKTLFAHLEIPTAAHALGSRPGDIKMGLTMGTSLVFLVPHCLRHSSTQCIRIHRCQASSHPPVIVVAMNRISLRSSHTLSPTK